ncbi:OB-fold-like protein [Raphanus sativus]|nr:OB-fold-like protein [Raphanus sativus]
MEFIPPERSKRLHNFRLPYLRWGQYIPQGCQATVFRWAAQGSPAGAGGEKSDGLGMSSYGSTPHGYHSQEVEFLCTAVVNGIETGNGWSYISCWKCYRKLQRGFSAFTCSAYQADNAVVVVRYRVQMNVLDAYNC